MTGTAAMRLRAIAAAAALALALMRPAMADTPLIAAAASLRGALPEIAAAYETETGVAVRLSFASSGTLARQIAQGAPFDVFLSADERFVLSLAQGGHVADAGRIYALGRLALVARPDGAVALDAAMTGVRTALAAGTLDRLALANPDHAPYGRAARQALQALNLWDATAAHRVTGENVAQAAQFAVSGPRTVGLVAASLLHAPGLKGRIAGVVLSDTLHAPVRHRMVLIDGDDAAAAAVYAYLASDAAATVFRAHGFAAPGGAS
jgi:molybdate transport system substrate-binding protein